jgi:hypothetical protein
VTTQHIGAAGELLVQYQLLKLDIDSARLTTDSGIDLVVYSPISGRATTVQVKSVRTPGPSGGRGRAAIGWNFLHDTRAELLALVLLSTDTVWLLTLVEAQQLAQQHTAGGVRRIYWYTDETIARRNGVPRIQGDMDSFRLEQRATALFLERAGRV